MAYRSLKRFPHVGPQSFNFFFIKGFLRPFIIEADKITSDKARIMVYPNKYKKKSSQPDMDVVLLPDNGDEDEAQESDDNGGDI